MNSISENNYLKEDLFHFLTGKYYKGKVNKYFFILYDKEKGVTSFYETNNIILAVDPAIDSSFKKLFLNNKERLQSFLNDVFFEPNGNKITSLEYVVGDFYDIGKKYNLNSLKADIVCKAKIKGIKNILIDIEIQINWLSELDNKFFEYSSVLRNADINAEIEELKENLKKKKIKGQKVKRIYNDIIVMGFIIPQNIYNKTNKIKLIKTEDNSNNQDIVPGLKIYEINLCELLNKLNTEKDVKLFDNYISKDGADWLKLIGLRCWANKKGGTLGRYILPRINENESYSKNYIINKTILDILQGSDLEMNLFSQLEEEFAKNFSEGRKEGEIEGIKKSQLMNIYNFLKLEKDKDLDFFSLDYTYKEKEIYEILKNTGSIRLDIIPKLLNYLKKRHRLE